MTWRRFLALLSGLSINSSFINVAVDNDNESKQKDDIETAEVAEKVLLQAFNV